MFEKRVNLAMSDISKEALSGIMAISKLQCASAPFDFDPWSDPP